MQRLMEPLRSLGWRAAVSIFGGLGLLTLYLYPGQHTFFRQHLAARWSADPLLDVWAHTYQHLAAFILLAVIPAIWIRLSGMGRLSQHGLALGDWRFGLKFLLAGTLVLAVPLYINAGSPDFQAEYPLAKAVGGSLGLFILWELIYLVYYMGWEFFFRGFWQFGLAGPLSLLGALALQTGVSTVMHIGKPMGETLTAIVGGLVLGLVAVRTRSILWVLLIHWYLGAMTDFFCLLRTGGWA